MTTERHRCEPLSERTPGESTIASSDSTSYACTSEERAHDVLRLLTGYVVLEGRIILDLGCGPNPLSNSFQQMSSRLVGLDKERHYIEQAKRNTSLQLILADATCLPFRDESFTFVLCNDVLEHVHYHVKLMKELLRVLARGGAAYVQCANKYQIIEPHFLLPFLSWIPRPFADAYARIARKGRSYEGYYPSTRKELLSLTSMYRMVDLTYRRTLLKIRALKIQSKLLLRVVLSLRRVLPDEAIATLAQNFSIISIIVFKD